MPLPPSNPEDFHSVLRDARLAMDMLAQLRIPPTPSRITVTYAHFADQNLDLSQSLNSLISKDKLTAQAVDELYEQHFGHAVDDAALKEASRSFERTVGDVSDCIGAANGKAQHFGNVLADFAANAQTADGAAIAAVLEETRDMAEFSRHLGERLNTSSREMAMLREHLEHLEREASIDALTGIPNRKAFDMQLRKAVVDSARSGRPLGLLMIDIDLFKGFNDAHGHLLGDQVLKLVARTMNECIKADDVPARYGGEEFAVILPGSSLDDAAAVANSIRLHVASKKVVNRRTGVTLGTITLSAGAAVYRAGESASNLVHRADEALYLAKQTGRNRVLTETSVVG